jgi:hypothetical protein
MLSAELNERVTRGRAWQARPWATWCGGTSSRLPAKWKALQQR